MPAIILLYPKEGSLKLAILQAPEEAIPLSVTEVPQEEGAMVVGRQW
jgi:hypothetical protein